MPVMRLGRIRDLRKFCQDFSRAMPRSTDALAVARAPVDGAPGEGEFTSRWPFESGGDPGAGVLVGAVCEDRDALALADSDDAGMRAAVRSWVRPGSAGEIHRSSSRGSVRTRTFTPCRRRLAE